MLPSTRLSLLLVCLLTLAVGVGSSPSAPDPFTGMKTGKVELGSADVLSFGPSGVLFVGDSQGAAVHALDTGTADAKPNASSEALEVEDIDVKIAAALGIAADDLTIHDMAVHPLTQVVYVAVTRGGGETSQPVILTVNHEGAIGELSTTAIRHSRADISDAPANDAKDQRGRPLRRLAVTDVAYAEGKLFVAGLSNEEFASSLRTLDFPFTNTSSTNSLEIYHGAHGQYETHSPIRTFLPYYVDGKAKLLAAYTCTPLVTFEMAALKPGAHVKGRTLAELGYGNAPLDMIEVERGEERFVLMANSRRTAMKFMPADLDKAPALEQPVGRDEIVAGMNFLPMPMTGVLHLDNLNSDNVLLMQRQTDDGSLVLRSFPKRWL